MATPDGPAFPELVCPTCGGRLDRRELGSADAALACGSCLVWYPVVGRVPVMLDFATPLHEEFAGRHATGLACLAGHTPPRGEPRPGERAVQETFTEEWQTVEEGELSFIFSADDLVEINRRVWLKWIDGARDRPRTVLDVGCGIGHESRALRAATGARVVGIDANLALARRRADAADDEGVRFVVASLFALPFPRESFDLVYSEGVLHHTYSTRAAFEAISQFVAPDGHLFVWLYGREDHLAGHGKRKAAMRSTVAIERVLRPVLARAPAPARGAFFAAAARLAHPLLQPRVLHPDRWQRADTEMYLRDWLSPPYAHRHGYNEVFEWFEDVGFDVLDVQSPRAYRDLFGYPIAGVGVTGRRSR